MNFKNYFVSAAAAALIASSTFSIGNFTATAETQSAVTTSIANNSKNLVAYNAYSDAAATKVSPSMSSNLDFTSRIEKTASGKIYAYLTLKNTDQFVGMKTEVNGVMTEVTTVSADAAAKTKLVKFEVTSLTGVVKTDIEINAGAYGMMNHTIYLKFDENAVVEKTTLAYNAYSDAAATKISPSMASNMDLNGQVEKAADGKYYAYTTLKNTDQFVGMKTEVNGVMTEVTTVSADAAAKTKLVKFEVPALGSSIKTDITIDAGSYGMMSHTIYLKFDVSPTTAEDVTPAPTPKPVVDPNKVISTTKYNYSLVTKSKKAKSAANSYMSKPIKVEKTQSGKYYATVTLKNASMWKSVKTEVNGKMKAVTPVSTNKTKNTKVVKFQVKSPKATTKTTFTLSTKVKVNKKAIAGKYTNYIKVGTKYVKPAVTVTSTKKYKFSVLKADKSAVSITDSYLVKPATITKMSDGKYYAQMTLKNADLWKSFKTQVNGKMVEVTTVSSNKTKNTKVVKFQVPSAKAQVKSTVHIKFTSYDHKYTNYIKLGSEVKSIAKVANATKTSKKTITVYKYKTKKKSVMNDYVKKTATVQKVGSKTYVKMTLNKASWWKSFKVKQGNKYVSAKVVSTKNNTRVVMFPVTKSQLKNGVYVKTHIVVKGMNYNNHYTTKVVFK